MKNFSPAGMATKDFYGLGARTFGNPDGARTGGGAWTGVTGSQRDGGANPNGPNQGGLAPALGNLALVINQDWIAAAPNGTSGVFVSQLMTAQQQADFQAGNYTSLSISGAGSPARGYWVVSGAAGTRSGTITSAGGIGLDFDLDANNASLPITINSAIVHFYGGGGIGGSAIAPLFGAGGNGGAAIDLEGFFTPTTIDITVNNSDGIHTGKLFGGGGGGGASGAAPVPPTVTVALGGGGGAGGWLPGPGGAASGGTLQNTPGNPGGTYDAGNGGTNDPNVAGGAGVSGGGTNSGAGGALGVTGSNAGGGGGFGGFAINREGSSGTTTIASGGGAANIRGTVQ